MAATLQNKAEHPSPFQDVINALAAQQVLLSTPEEIRAYLDQHADLVSVLPAVGARVRQEFGEEAELSLAVYRDPEIDDHYLMLCVRQPVYDPDILARIRGVRALFEEEWNGSSGWLLVTTDFRAPRCAHAL
jgi:hypothetical protein